MLGDTLSHQLLPLAPPFKLQWLQICKGHRRGSLILAGVGGARALAAPVVDPPLLVTFTVSETGATFAPEVDFAIRHMETGSQVHLVPARSQTCC